MSVAHNTQNFQDIATQVDESDYFMVKDGVRYDLRVQADCDQVQAILEMELAAMRYKWEVVKAEADALLKAVENGIF